MAEPAREVGSSDSLEEQIEQWRSYLRRRQAIRPVDVEELEDHLRGEVAALRGTGLSENEAFLVAVKRMGALDAISNEFAREHSERLWKQLVISNSMAESADQARRETAGKRWSSSHWRWLPAWLSSCRSCSVGGGGPRGTKCSMRETSAFSYSPY
jgi:hypothetical protein